MIHLRFRQIRFFLIITMLLAPCAMMITEGVLYSQNSLYLNKQWIVQKRMRQMGLMGSDDFLLSRHSLAQNTLDLSKYFGFQEVIYRQVLKFDRVEFKFSIENLSYLDFTFSRNEKKFSGIRLSKSERFPSGIFVSSSQGGFHVFDKISMPLLRPGWHKAIIEDSSEGIMLKIDEHVPIILPKQYKMDKGQIGFRSGYLGAKIENLTYLASQGAMTHLSFRNSKNYFQTFLFHFAVLIFIGLFLSKLTTGKFVTDSKYALFHWMLLSLLGFFCAGSWYLFDYFYYSKLIPEQSSITRSIFDNSTNRALDFEHLRFLLFKSLYQRTGGDVISHRGISQLGYPANQVGGGPIYCSSHAQQCKSELNSLSDSKKVKKQLAYRIIFIGSSQTIGAGADTLEDSFFVRTHRIIGQDLSPKIHLESINISMSGQDSTALFRHYKASYLNLQPDLVVINLSNNDGNQIIFKKNMMDILGVHRAHGITTVLIEEANLSGERKHVGLETNHKTLRQLAQQFHLPIFPLHQYLNSEESIKSGTLWWDYVHLSSYGHQVTAGALAPFILQELLKIPVKKRSLIIED